MTELGRAYGSALYALAEDEKQEDAFLSQLGEVCKLLADNPDYVRLIKDKAIAKTERLALLDGDRCGGCNMSLPTSTVKRVATGEGIVECENCGRILYA